MIRFLYFLFLIVIASCKLFAANNNLLSKSNYQQLDSNYISLLLKKGEAIKHSNKEEALKLFVQAEYYAEEKKYPILQVKTLILISDYYTAHAKYDSTEIFLQKAIIICQTNHLEYEEVKTCMKMASLYYNKCDYPKTLEWFFLSLEKLNCCENDTAKSSIFSNMANVYYRIQDYSKSLEYLNKSLAINKKIGNDLDLIKTYNNLANVYADFQNHDTALMYYFEVLNKANEINSIQYLAISNANIAGIYREKSEYETALKYAFNALNYDSALNYLYGIAADYNEIAFSYKGQKKYTKAIIYLQKSLNIMDSIKAYDLKINLYKDFSETYSESGNYKLALEYYKKHTFLKDSLLNQSKNRQIIEAEKKYETQLKNEKIQQLKIKNLENKNIQKLFLLIIGALLITAVFLIIFFRLKVRTNAVLNDKNSELQQLNATQNRLMSIISHDFKAPLSAFYSITNSLKTKFDKIKREDIDNYLNRMLNSSIALKLQLENMLNWSINQSRTINVNKKLFNLHILTFKVVMILQEFANEKKVVIDNKINEDVEIETDGKLLSIIINNLISNAVKFSHPNSKVELSVKKNSSNLIISVKDFGVGMSKKDIANLFTNSGNVTQTENSGTGLGLIVSYDIITKLGGKLWIKSELTKGSEFFIMFDN